MIDYNVVVKTGNKLGAGTDANVRIQLMGELGQTDKNGFLLNDATLLSSLANTFNNFEKNSICEFKVRADKDLGKIEKVKIWHDDSGAGSGWYLEFIQVSLPGTGNWMFKADRWLATDEADGKTEAVLTVEGGIPESIIQHEEKKYITVKRKDEIFDNLGNSHVLKDDFKFYEEYSSEIRYETTESTEKSAEAKFSASAPVKAVELSLELSASITNKLESKYGKTEVFKKTFELNRSIEVNPHELVIVSGILTQEMRVGTIIRGTRSIPFKMPVGEAQLSEKRFSYQKGDPIPENAKEIEEILTKQNTSIPW